MKKFLIGASAIAVVLGLASCKPSTPDPVDPVDPVDPDPVNPDPVDPDPTPEIKEFNATIWVSETAGVKELTQSQVNKWNESNGKYKINATIEGITEADSASQMLTDVESGADLYCFAQDQMNRLIIGGALNKLGVKASEKVQSENSLTAVNAAKVGGDIYAYPITADNGFFMFYDKTVVKAEHLNSLEDIIADCAAAGKNFSMENETSAWYLASWFFGAGCQSTWTTDTTGKFVSVNDTFDSEAGVIAMRGMQHLVKASNYVSSSQAADFAAATPSAVVVTGTWAVNTAKEILGDNLACAKLPTYTVDGKSYQMGSFSGFKYMGVKPQADATKAAALHSLAQYLSGEECQLERFNNFGWGPSNLVDQQNEAVKADPALTALNEQAPYSTAQGQIHGSWWDIAKVLGDNAKSANYDDEEALKKALDSYKGSIDKLFTMSEEELRAFTVIGSLDGSNWLTDYEMAESPANVWTSVDAFKITDEDITNGYNRFKCRQGKSWDVCYPSDDYIIENAGTYKIKLTVTDTGGTVELINC